MNLALRLALDGLGPTLKTWLPLGIEPRGVELEGDSLRVTAKAPMIGEVVLVAHVDSKPGELIVSRFDLEGAGLAKSLVLAKLREKVSDLDEKRGPFHVWGETDGERVRVRWHERR